MAIETMKIDPSAVVQPDFELPRAADVLQPVLFQESNQYCCLLGPDPQAGVFGCGTTAQEAVNDWEQHLKDRVNNAGKSDKLAGQIVDELNKAIQSNIEEQVKEFYAQVRPVDKSKTRVGRGRV